MASVWSLFFHNANPLQVSSLQLFFISEVPCYQKSDPATPPMEIRLYQGMKKPPWSLHRGLVSRVPRWIPHDTKRILQVFRCFFFPRCFSCLNKLKDSSSHRSILRIPGHIKKKLRENWGNKDLELKCSFNIHWKF